MTEAECFEVAKSWPLPTETVARKVFLSISASMLSVRPWASQLLPGRARLVSFRQTHTRQGVFRGVKVYRIEYEALAVAVDDMTVYGDVVLYQQGRTLIERGTLTFELTQRGWRGEDGQVY